MRVVHYYPNAMGTESGVTNAARGWAAALAGLGHDVALAFDPTLRGLDELPQVESRPVEHRTRGPFRVPIGLDVVAGDAELVVLHGGWLPANNAASSALRAASIPYVLVGHGAYLPHVLGRSRFRKAAWTPIERRMLRNALAIHLLFDDERLGLERLHPAATSVVVPNGSPVPPTGIHWDGGSMGSIAWLGRYDLEHKGLDRLVDALAVLDPGERPTLHLRGTDWRGGQGALAERVRALGLDDCVTIDGPVYGTDKWRFLASASAFALPSRWEGSPMSLAEAMSLGVPCLVTPFAMGRMLADRGAAVLADGDPEALAAGLRHITSADASRVATAGRELAETELSWRSVAEAWCSQVEPLLAGAASS